MNKDEMIKTVYQQLKNREIHPAGEFDNAGRFFAKHADLFDSVREPSRAYPYSQMTSARALKNVKKLYDHFKPANLTEFIAMVT